MLKLDRILYDADADGIVPLTYLGFIDGFHCYEEPVEPLPVLQEPLPPVVTGTAPTTGTRILNGGAQVIANKYFLGGLNAKLMEGIWASTPDRRAGMWDIGKTGGAAVFRRYGGSLNDIDFLRIRHDNAEPSTTGYGCLLFGGPCSNIRIEDLWFRAIKPTEREADIFAAICFRGKGDSDTGTNFILKRIYIEGMVMTGSQYNNCDGISFESGYSNIIGEDIRIHNCSDAGIDNKGGNSSWDRVHVSDCRESVKNWSSCTYGSLISENPRAAHIMAMGRPTMNTHRYGRVEAIGSGRPLVLFESVSTTVPSPSTVIIEHLEASTDQVLHAHEQLARGSRLVIENLGVDLTL